LSPVTSLSPDGRWGREFSRSIGLDGGKKRPGREAGPFRGLQDLQIGEEILKRKKV
jgi:hypothetical protein